MHIREKMHVFDLGKKNLFISLWFFTCALRTPRQAREMNAAGLAYAEYHLKLSKMSFQMLGCACDA